MVLREPGWYVQSIRDIKPRIYVAGERVRDPYEHPNTKPVLNAIAKTYELALSPEHAHIAAAESHLTGEPISRFNRVCLSTEDLVKRTELNILLSQKTGTCNYRCVGCDALTALYSITYEMDQRLGTSYHERLKAFLRHVQGKDLACSGALTDPKGDRRRRPKEQADPDLYLHVVEKRDDGIIVRGCKVHQSGAFGVHEIIVLPGMAFRPGEEEYAVAFAVPNGTRGLTFIMQETAQDAERRAAREEHTGLPDFGVRTTCMLVFDDVFVPWERVFMCGEVEFTRELVMRFASMHRTSGAACKAGFGDVIIGAAYAIAEYNGLSGAHYIRGRLTDMIWANEATRGLALAAAYRGIRTPSGAYVPDPVLANTAKLESVEAFTRLLVAASDIAGGLVVTMPSEANLDSPDVGDWVRKYLVGTPEVPVEHRLRMFKFLQNWVAGPHLAGAIHGGGSPAAQKIALMALSNLEAKKALAEELAGIREEKH